MPFENPSGPTRRSGVGESDDSSGGDDQPGGAQEDIEILEIEAVDDAGLPLEPPPHAAAGDSADEEEGVRREADVSAELQELRERHIRLLAEFENYRKRRDREAQESRAAGAEALLLELLPSIDNLERALETTPPDTPTSVREGLGLIRKHLIEAMSRQGIVETGVPGETFDPHFHEAVAIAEGTEDDAGGHRVVETIQRGYLFRGRLLRPALVKVGVYRDEGGTAGQSAGER